MRSPLRTHASLFGPAPEQRRRSGPASAGDSEATRPLRVGPRPGRRRMAGPLAALPVVLGRGCGGAALCAGRRRYCACQRACAFVFWL
jgi:hypothetical protein